jgi:hypothetical protein
VSFRGPQGVRGEFNLLSDISPAARAAAAFNSAEYWQNPPAVLE